MYLQVISAATHSIGTSVIPPIVRLNASNIYNTFFLMSASFSVNYINCFYLRLALTNRGDCNIP